MARTKIDTSLHTRSARAKLAVRKEPYWLPLEKGRALGYRKGLRGGNWIAKFYEPTAKPARQAKSLGAADDFSDADGKMVLSFSQAQEAAREWFKVAYHEATGDRVQTGAYTVWDAIEDYLADRERQGAKTAARMRGDLTAHVKSHLGDIHLDKLVQKRVEDWLKAVATSPVRRRGKEGHSPTTEDELRARKETANRIWKNLKAALNLAYRDKRVSTDAGWKNVKPFKGTKSARLRFLTINEQQRLVNAASASDFRSLLQAALFTGAREGELMRLQVKDFDPDHAVLFIATSKSGKSRHIALTAEALPFFHERTAGKPLEARIFPRTQYDRKPKGDAGNWSRAELSRTMRATCKAAGLEALVFHELRHTCASTWINAGISLFHVAEQLGHRDTRMVHEHYGHICQSAKAEAVRKLTPVLGIHQPEGIAPLEIRKA